MATAVQSQMSVMKAGLQKEKIELITEVHPNKSLLTPMLALLTPILALLTPILAHFNPNSVPF